MIQYSEFLESGHGVFADALGDEGVEFADDGVDLRCGEWRVGAAAEFGKEGASVAWKLAGKDVAGG